MDILKKIEQYREEEQRLKWEGTFAEYLEIVKENPTVAQSAHSRVYNMIKDSGIEEKDGKKYTASLTKSCLVLKSLWNALLKNTFIRPRSALMSEKESCF